VGGAATGDFRRGGGGAGDPNRDDQAGCAPAGRSAGPRRGIRRPGGSLRCPRSGRGSTTRRAAP